MVAQVDHCDVEAILFLGVQRRVSIYIDRGTIVNLGCSVWSVLV